MPTIYDVARRARVSTYTVSAVLNRSAYVSPELTERVHAAVRELDYTINELARSLHTRKTRTAGMLIPDIANPFYAKVVRGVEDVLKQSGYSLILGNTYNDAAEQTRYLGVFRAKQVDGMLLFVAAGAEEELQPLVAAQKPVVFVGRTPSQIKADSVSADNLLGTRMAIEHLIAKGHKTIALLPGETLVSTGADRVAGWRSALESARLAAPNQLIGACKWSAESGFQATQELLSRKSRPTAIFAANFLLLTGALRAIQEADLRVPKDIEVMSSDDSEWLDVFTPRISTVAQPSYEMGSQAAGLLLKRIKTPGRRYAKIVLPPELRIR
ncbi:MAG TPA: LacI family DNA-binding transcriptional regulator [Bryobacteraceae bacterium]